MVCDDDEIDEVMLEHLANISAYLTIYSHLENSLKSGRIALAKTRCNSSVGSAEISQTSYNLADMSTNGASACVNIDEHETFNLVDVLDSFNTQTTGNDRSNSSSEPKASDPINWFCGVLVPPQLRQAQTNFRRGIRLVTDLATRRAALLSSSKRLNGLISSKVRAEPNTPLISLDEPVKIVTNPT